MTCLQKNRKTEDTATQPALVREFHRVFTDEIDGLYQLAFLLTGDRETAKRCVVAGLEGCVQSNQVFKEWARSWARRTIIENAIRALKPQPDGAGVFSPVAASADNGKILNIGAGLFDFDSVLALPGFERFVFVMSVLEGYSEHDCALFLRCTLQEVQSARIRALGQILDSRYNASPSEANLEAVQEPNR